MKLGPDSYKDREVWLTWHIARITGTNAATILDKNSWSIRQYLYWELKNQTELEPANRDWLEYCLDLEPLVDKRFRRQTGRKTRHQRARQHDQYDYIGCTIDYQIISDPRGPGIAEYKTVREEIYREVVLHGPREKDLIQLAHNIGVWNYSWGCLVYMDRESGEIKYYDIDHDQEFWGRLLAAEVQFMEDVRSGNEPQPAPEIVIPKPSGELVEVDDDELTLALDEREVAKFDEAMAKARVKSSSGWVEGIMRRHKVEATERDGRRVYCRQQQRSTFDKKLLALEHPEIDQAKYMKRGEPFYSVKVYDRRGSDE